MKICWKLNMFVMAESDIFCAKKRRRLGFFKKNLAAISILPVMSISMSTNCPPKCAPKS